ncbi:hypothetical protein PENSTE_c014G08601 [Penicillium steckii]|uniref:Protein kinase domain-containing protein n=1 Tax=Penicillium steckii TaxID=303698 RepID=A0A1V6T135_9EURO|nr:hypothetical protein PENSTE_c014G08601 [Penicillium steckii]
MAGIPSSQDLSNRASQFPRTGTKRAVENLERVVQDTSQSARRLKKSQTTPIPRSIFAKEYKSPWEHYQKTFKLNQAGHGLVVHGKNATFAEGVMKEIKSIGKEELEKIKSYSHENLVQMQRVFYDEGAVFLLYEIMDVTLAQISNSPLGRLQSYEVAAFSQEVLAGIDYIHRVLGIVHGQINSDSILLSTSGAVKIGKSPD